MAFRTMKITLEDDGDLCPINLHERSTPPANPEVNDVYLDDGTNYGGGSGIPGLRRCVSTGPDVWEDLGIVGSGKANIDGGRADEDFGGVGLSPIDGGDASSF